MAAVDPDETINRATLNEAVEAILEGMNKMVGGLRNEMSARFDAVDSRFDKLEPIIDSNYSGLKDEIDGLKAELSVVDPKNWTLPKGVELITRNEVYDGKETKF
jgi:hypothetical protein